MFISSRDKLRFESPRENLVPFMRESSKTIVNDSTSLCPICEVGYCSDTDLEFHKKKAHRTEIQSIIKNEKYTCLNCIQRFDSWKKLLEHFKTHHLLCSAESKRLERDTYICNGCRRIFFSKEMLIIHLHFKHKFLSKDKKFECPKCYKKVKGVTMKSHLQLHNIDSMNVCPVCFHKFPNVQALISHVRNSHPPSFKCDVCWFKTRKADVYDAHLLNKHPNNADIPGDFNVDNYFVPDSKDYPPLHYVPAMAFKGISVTGTLAICVLCREICTSASKRQEHIKKAHMLPPEIQVEKKQYICTCGKEFFNNLLLKHHKFKSGCDKFTDTASSYDNEDLIKLLEGTSTEVERDDRESVIRTDEESVLVTNSDDNDVAEYIMIEIAENTESNAEDHIIVIEEEHNNETAEGSDTR